MSIESSSSGVEIEKNVSASPEVGAATVSPAVGELELPEGIKHVYDLFKGHLDGSGDIYSSVISLEERKRNVTDWVAHHVDRNRISLEEGLAVLIELNVIESQDI